MDLKIFTEQYSLLNYMKIRHYRGGGGGRGEWIQFSMLLIPSV